MLGYKSSKMYGSFITGQTISFYITSKASLQKFCNNPVAKDGSQDYKKRFVIETIMSFKNVGINYDSYADFAAELYLCAIDKQE